MESQRGDEWRDEQFVKLSGSAFDEIQKANNSMDANSSDFRFEIPEGGEKGGEQKGDFGFRNRIRVERRSDIAGRALVSTCVLKVSAQNFPAFQRKVLNAAFHGISKPRGRHFLPDTVHCGNPGSFACAQDSSARCSRLVVVRDILNGLLPNH